MKRQRAYHIQHPGIDGAVAICLEPRAKYFWGFPDNKSEHPRTCRRCAHLYRRGVDVVLRARFWAKSRRWFRSAA